MSDNYWIGGASGATNTWSTDANWSLGVVPVDGDDVFFENSSVSVTAGLSQSAVQLTSLNIAHTYTGEIGTAALYLQIGSGAGSLTVNIGLPSGRNTGTGSPRLKINVSSLATVFNIYNTAGTTGDSETGLEPVRLLGTNITAINVSGGLVGVATTNSSETSTVTTVRVTNAANTTGTLNLGRGVTWTNGVLSDGELVAQSDVADFEMRGGIFTMYGSGAVTSELRINGGTCFYNSIGTIAAAHILGVLDFSGDSRAATVTVCNLYDSGELNADNASPSTIVFTGNILVQYPADLQAVTIKGTGITAVVNSS